MTEAPFLDALNACVDRLHAGDTVDACLRDFPEYAALLRPLLETGLTVRAAQPIVPLGAKARVRTRVLAAADALEPARPARRWSPPIWRAAALLIMVIGVGALLAWLLREPSASPNLNVVPLDTVTATVTFTAAPTASSTPSETPTESPSETPTESASETPTDAPSETPTDAPTATPTVRLTAPPTATARPTQTASQTPTTQTPTPTRTPTPSVTPRSANLGGGTASPSPEPCQITFTPASLSLRAGPGLGATVQGYAYSGEVALVVAIHETETWLEVDIEGQRYWVAASVGTLSGACESVPRSAQTLQNTFESGATMTPAATQSGSGSGNSGSGGSGSGGSGSGSSGSGSGESGEGEHGPEQEGGEEEHGEEHGGDD